MEDKKNEVMFFNTRKGTEYLYGLLNSIDQWTIILRDQKYEANRSGSEKEAFKMNQIMQSLYKMKDEVIHTMDADGKLRFKGLCEQDNGSGKYVFSLWESRDRNHKFMTPARYTTAAIAFGKPRKFEGEAKLPENFDKPEHSIGLIRKQVCKYTGKDLAYFNRRGSLFNNYNKAREE